MSLLSRIFAEPELLAEPPVLVDVGAAGGVHPAWRKIARYSIGFGFEPDARESAPLGKAQRLFKQWKFSPTVAWPTQPANGRVPFYLTRSPQCSSGLVPDAAHLSAWAFAELFAVEQTSEVRASTLQSALAAHGLSRIDWLKCDTQGLDLALYRSLPDDMRRDILAVEFEPGAIDAYVGEEKLGTVFTAMSAEPFWLARCDVKGTPRGRARVVSDVLGPSGMRWLRRLGPTAPAWANVCWLRDVTQQEELLGRRSFLLAWVFTTLSAQPAEALVIAESGQRRFPGPLFTEMLQASRRQLWLAMAARVPAALLRRCGFAGR